MTDEQRISDAIKYIQNLGENIRAAERLVGKWTTPKARKAQLLREIAHDRTVVGISHFVAANTREAHASFLAAMDALEQAEELGPAQNVTYATVQILSGAVCAGAEPRARKSAAVLFSNASVEHLARAGRTATDVENLRNGAHGQLALVGWMGRCAKAKVESHARSAMAARPPMEQFRIWGECTYAAIVGDAAAFQRAIDALATFAAKERKSGDFKYSEDRHAYLPGLGIVALAMRDQIAVEVPRSVQWPLELMKGM